MMDLVSRHHLSECAVDTPQIKITKQGLTRQRGSY